MASEWEEATLGAEADMLTGFPFRSERYTDADDSIRLVRGDNIVQGALRWDGVKRWPGAESAEHELYQLREGDVVLAMDRPWIEAGLKYAAISKHELPCLLVQRTARLRGGPNLETRFLRYLIGSPKFTQHIHAITTGTAVPHISRRQIREFTFLRPPLDEQRAIAHILGTLDDKIELNRRMNETLEAMARALFKSWFVDFDPVRAKAEGRDPGLPKPLADLFPDSFEDSELGEIPKGWSVQRFADTVNIIGGGTPKTSVPEYWDGDIPWFSVVDAPSTSEVWVVNTAKKITRQGVENSSTRILSVGTTIISARGTVGRIALVALPMAMNQSCYGLRGKVGQSGYYTYYATRELVTRLQQHAHGSVFDTITQDSLAGVSLASPPARLIEAFETSIGSTLERIRASLLSSRTLATLRDTLLPKLISGELRVAVAEQIVENT